MLIYLISLFPLQFFPPFYLLFYVLFPCFFPYFVAPVCGSPGPLKPKDFQGGMNCFGSSGISSDDCRPLQLQRGDAVLFRGGPLRTPGGPKKG